VPNDNLSTAVSTCALTTGLRMSAADLFLLVRGPGCKLTTLEILRWARNDRTDSLHFHQMSNDMLISSSTKGIHLSIYAIPDATANRNLGNIWNKTVLHLLQSTRAWIELAVLRILSHTI